MVFDNLGYFEKAAVEEDNRGVMTAQIDDLFRYQDRDYAVVGISEGELFHPSRFGLEPGISSTACWRGYQAIYALADSRLVLDALYLNLFQDNDKRVRQEGPPINGVSPAGPSGKIFLFNNYYYEIEHLMDYTGGLLLARGFIQELYVHMGFHPAWKYANVLEFVFDGGVLQKQFDRSEQMAEIRALYGKLDKPSKMPTEEEIRDFVERSFDRSYRMSSIRGR